MATDGLGTLAIKHEVVGLSQKSICTCNGYLRVTAAQRNGKRQSQHECCGCGEGSSDAFGARLAAVCLLMLLQVLEAHGMIASKLLAV